MAAPATRARTKVSEGRSKYQALTAISVPQRSDGGVLTGQNNLVMPGEIVELDEREAANLMATGPRTGRQHPAIRPASEEAEPRPRLHPRQLSGLLRVPAPPPPDSDQPRPDPPGASKILVQEPPEAAEPQPGDENAARPWAVGGAIDITPGTART